MRLFLVGERAASLYAMPLGETASTTSRRGVLCDEHWMSFERRLLAIVLWCRWRQPLRNEIPGVSENGGKPFVLKIGFLFIAEAKVLAKRRVGQSSKEIVEVSHNTLSIRLARLKPYQAILSAAE